MATINLETKLFDWCAINGRYIKHFRMMVGLVQWSSSLVTMLVCSGDHKITISFDEANTIRVILEIADVYR